MTDPSIRPPAAAQDLRNFGLTFGAVAGVFGLLLLWRGRVSGAWGFLAASGVFVFVAVLLPGLLRPFYGPWMRFAEILGYINTRILLGLFFVVGMTPTGLIMRLLGKDPLSRTFKDGKDGSYWTRPPVHPDGTRHFDRQF